MPPIPDKCRLLHGPYPAPPLERGDRAECHLRGAVLVTAWTAARIAWPRCRAIGSRGGSGVLLDDELARAVRQESAAAVGYWWGVHSGVVWRWRTVLGVDRVNNPSTHQLVQAAAQAGAEAVKAKEWTDAERQARRRNNKRLNLARHLHPGYHGPKWTDEQKALLGKLPDAEVAARIGRAENAVRIKRTRLGIATAWDRRQREEIAITKVTVEIALKR